jgi:hypothetical protein
VWIKCADAERDFGTHVARADECGPGDSVANESADRRDATDGVANEPASGHERISASAAAAERRRRDPGHRCVGE